MLENASQYTVTITAIDVPLSEVTSNIKKQLLETFLNHNYVETR